MIIFKGFPVMAMMRLSTSASDGKANLHQGAVGWACACAPAAPCGRCSLATRCATTRTPAWISTIWKVPHWDTLLNLAASCYEMSGLGYIGTDMVLDKFRGPMLLELNARPGLAIQIANGRGLVPNLKTIEAGSGQDERGAAGQLRQGSLRYLRRIVRPFCKNAPTGAFL